MKSLSLPAAALFLGLLPDPAAACSCLQPPPYAERRLQHHSVFHGKVTASGMDEARQLRWFRFGVIKDYSPQASVSDTVTLWTPGDMSSCAVGYPVGTEILIFADTGSYPQTKPAGALHTGYCHGNVSGNGLGQALLAMEQALGVRPDGARIGTRHERTRVDCGQILFEGQVQANGALRKPAVRSAVSR